MAPHTEAAAPTASTHVSIPFLSCAVCRAIIEANTTPQQPEDLAALKKIAADLNHELLAAKGIIAEMYDVMPSAQRHIVAARLQFTGLLSGIIGITRSLEQADALAKAKAAGIK